MIHDVHIAILIMELPILAGMKGKRMGQVMTLKRVHCSQTRTHRLSNFLVCFVFLLLPNSRRCTFLFERPSSIDPHPAAAACCSPGNVAHYNYRERTVHPHDPIMSCHHRRLLGSDTLGQCSGSSFKPFLHPRCIRHY
jgi:hypothetical protein